MYSRIWVLLAVLFVLLILGILVIAISLKSKKKRPVDYYALFVMGIIWLPFGIILENYAFLAIGLILTIVGSVNKDKWKKNRMTWDKLDEKEKKFRLVIIIVLSVLVLAGVAALILFNSGIIS